MLSASTITVILPHYKCEPYLGGAIGSILSQSFDDITLVVVDDHSYTDQWYEVTRTFAADERLVAFRSSRRVGPYRLKNAVLSMARSPYIAFQDADDLSDPARLALQQCAFMRRPSLGVVGTGYVQELEGFGLRQDRRMPSVCNELVHAGQYFVVLHPTSMIKTGILRGLGGFDPSTLFGADDDFIMRAAQVCEIGNVDGLLYFYRRRADSLTCAPDTGVSSPARRAYRAAMLERAKLMRVLSGDEYGHEVLKPAARQDDWRLERVLLR